MRGKWSQKPQTGVYVGIGRFTPRERIGWFSLRFYVPFWLSFYSKPIPSPQKLMSKYLQLAEPVAPAALHRLAQHRDARGEVLGLGPADPLLVSGGLWVGHLDNVGREGGEPLTHNQLGESEATNSGIDIGLQAPFSMRTNRGVVYKINSMYQARRGIGYRGSRPTAWSRGSA